MYPSSCITVIAAPADLFFSLAFFKRSIKSSGALLVKYDSNVCVLVVPGIFPKGHRSCGASNADKLRVTLCFCVLSLYLKAGLPLCVQNSRLILSVSNFLFISKEYITLISYMKDAKSTASCTVKYLNPINAPSFRESFFLRYLM